MRPQAEACPESTAVYRAAAAAYRNISDTNLTVQQLTQLLEGPGGYLAQYDHSVKALGCTRNTAAVYANAITAAADALAEIGGNYIVAVSGLDMPVPLLTAIGITLPPIITDPAVAAFVVINILLEQYGCTASHPPAGYNSCQVADVFSQAFRDIYTSLVTTIGATNHVVDITYISAVAHYVEVQLDLSFIVPIISPAVPKP